MVSALDRKLMRDLWRIKGQALAIALVIAMGVMLQVMMSGLVNSLSETRATYYDRYRFADVFAPVTRAPDRALADLARIDGVAAVRGRINGGALIDLPGDALPIRAQAVSLPDGAQRLNDIFLAEGHLPNPDRPDEIVLLQGFADAHGLRPGDTLTVTMNGVQRVLRISGLAQAPEFLITTAPGELAPDDARFAVIWMTNSALAAAYDMQGAFNEALITLGRGASPDAVFGAVDRVLESSGSQGAFLRENHASDRFISDEISSLRSTSVFVPPIFLGVAAFLLYIVISRIVQAEREQIGLLKAFGYTDREVGVHYFKMVIAIALLGAALGSLAGIALGRNMTGLYQVYYKFPFLLFRLDPASFAIGTGVSVLTASAGALVVLRRVARLTPAVAMRPPAPVDYSHTGRIGAWLQGWLDQPSRMVLRRITRNPGRMGGAVLGIGAGMALAVAMVSILDGFDNVLDQSFTIVDRSDLAVTFIQARGGPVLHELEHIPGVIAVEGVRFVPARLVNGRNTYRGAINGLQTDPQLNRAVDAQTRPIPLPGAGIVLGRGLADVLDIRAGQSLRIEVLTGARPTFDLPVTAIADTLVGSPAYMRLDALNRALGQQDQVSGAYLRIDSAAADQIFQKIKKMPQVAGATLKSRSRASIERLMNESAGRTRFIMSAVAAIITFGIVYNAARIAQAERSRDLASLRVIGFSRAEVAFVMLGELALVTFAALPLGIALGFFLAFGIAKGFSTDMYQITATFSPGGMGRAVVAVLLSAIVSGWLVKRDMDRTELVTALKMRD